MPESTREQKLSLLVQSALAYFEMRHERGFTFELPLAWVKSAHEIVYGEPHAQLICDKRIAAARERMLRNAR